MRKRFFELVPGRCKLLDGKERQKLSFLHLGAYGRKQSSHSNRGHPDNTQGVDVDISVTPPELLYASNVLF